TRDGRQQHICVGLQYIDAWRRGAGCEPRYNLMEDAATAEICRAQLWQWIRHEARMENGATVTAERFDLLLGAELEQVHHEVGPARFRSGAFSTAVRLFSSMVKNDSFDEFLT